MFSTSSGHNRQNSRNEGHTIPNPLSGAEEQTARAFSAYPQHACLISFQIGSVNPGGRGCAKNPAKRFLVVALLVLKKLVSSEALRDGRSAENQAKACSVFF